MAKIEGLHDSFIVTTFTKRLSPLEERLYNYITWDNIITKAHLFTKCEKYLDTEEEYKTRHGRE